MRRDKKEDSFVWRPTDGERGRVLAMLTIALSCALFGFVAGRLFPTKTVSLSTVDDSSKPSRPSSLKRTQDISAVPPKTDAADKGAADSPAFTLLNPGVVVGNEASAASDSESNLISPPSGPHQELTRQTELPPGKAAGKRVGPAHPDRTGSTLADYGALRDYMMRR